MQGLDGAIADRIWDFVQHKGNPADVAAFLRSSPAFESESVKYVMGVVDEMQLLFSYLESYGVRPPAGDHFEEFFFSKNGLQCLLT